MMILNDDIDDDVDGGADHGDNDDGHIFVY
jgi:hypothetical protein